MHCGETILRNREGVWFGRGPTHLTSQCENAPHGAHSPTDGGAVEELRSAAGTLRTAKPLRDDLVEPLAEWLEHEAYMADRRGLSIEGNTFHALKVARVINGTAK